MAVRIDLADGGRERASDPLRLDSHGHDFGDGRDDERDSADHDDHDPNGRSQKKRRIFKNPGKKFECPQPDCGKAYSRAEHLYRHQLNHAPKEIYRCDFAGCDRSFVRSDLCTRHRERHTAKGSHLQRKDEFLSSRRSIGGSTNGPPPDPDGSHRANPPPPQSHGKNGYQYGSTSNGYPSPTRTAQPFAPTRQHMPSLPTTNVMPNLPPLNTDDRGGPYEPQRNPYPTYPPVMNGGGGGGVGLGGGAGVGAIGVGSGGGGGGVGGGGGAGPMRTTPNQSPALGMQRNSVDGMSLGHPSAQMNNFPQQQPNTNNPMSSLAIPSPTTARPMFGSRQYSSPTSGTPVGRGSIHETNPPSTYPGLAPIHSLSYPQPYVSMPPPPPNMNSQRPMSVSVSASPAMGLPEQTAITASQPNAMVDLSLIDPVNCGYAMPVFASETPFMRSPPAVDENLLNFLLNSTGMDMNDPSPPEAQETMQSLDLVSMQFPKTEQDMMAIERTSVSPSEALEIDRPESTISHKKQIRLLSLVQKYEDIDHNPGHWKKADILAGNADDHDHVMSLKMLKTYLASYWLHMHQQMPILHRPTFNPETCPEPLLLAMMCLGATCLERMLSNRLTQVTAELTFFIAHHIRWEVFKDPEFRPTAKLWTFQTMLLLELFEKMYSTRHLHERAHVHHATTLVVMRRGSSLIGRSAVDSLGREDPTRTPPGPDGSINTSGTNTADAYWNRWITAEATRRTAFAAFVIDSTHATLFGHSAHMSPHDLHLPLPCDESLWSAGSGGEVQRIETAMASSGYKPIRFLDGLRRTLNGQKVRTNTFGRVVLMAGLLNVSWHMNQRDLQVSSLGATSTLGSQARWRAPLTRAFDHWRRDFDDSLAKNEQWLAACGRNTTNAPPAERGSPEHRDIVFEARTCLHSLAHMAMHVDIVDCQVFAGSTHALGRVVTDGDRAAVQRRMRDDWAPTARARDSVFYALRFLCEVLLQDEETMPLPTRIKEETKPNNNNNNTTTTTPHNFHNPNHIYNNQARPGPNPLAPPPAALTYSVNEDYLLNRPWVLYFAMLIVWAYGYALDGPLRSPTPNTGPGGDGVYVAESMLPNHEARASDAHRFLKRMGGVASPDDLEKMPDRNQCLGLLLLLRHRFQQPRWELLREAADSLAHCVRLLLPTVEVIKPASRPMA